MMPPGSVKDNKMLTWWVLLIWLGVCLVGIRFMYTWTHNRPDPRNEESDSSNSSPPPPSTEPNATPQRRRSDGGGVRKSTDDTTHPRVVAIKPKSTKPKSEASRGS